MNSSMVRRQAMTTSSSLLYVQVRKRYPAGGGSHFELETEFNASPGVTVILGHSGAGKSTLLRCIAGLCEPEEGRIASGSRTLFDSHQKVNIEIARREVAFVFQDLALFPHLTVEQNVAYGLRRLDAPERGRRVSNILQSFQIDHLRKRLPRHISGGEQQRVALARSLVIEPSVLLLDEPLSSLDMRTKAGIIDDLHKWNAARRIPILYVTHSHEETFALGEHVITLEQGRIVAEGSPLEVLSATGHEAVARSDDFENLFYGTVVGIQGVEGTITCRLARTSVELKLPLTRVTLGETIEIGVRASDVLLASARPEMISSCNLIRGRIKSLSPLGARLEARIDCGAEFRAYLASGSIETSRLTTASETWMMIRSHSCRIVRKKAKLGALQRLFVFVCTHNIKRSPMAQAICNAEIARRLGVPIEALGEFGVQAISAGIAATPGAPMAAEAEHALRELGLPPVKHRSQNLDASMVQQAEAVFCMTATQRHQATAMFPEAASKIHCLHLLGDIEDPTGQGPEAFLSLANLLRETIFQRLDNLGAWEKVDCAS